MVETGGLENRLRGDSHGGSNPPSSAKAPLAIRLRVQPDPDHVEGPHCRKGVVAIKARSRGYSKKLGGLPCGLFIGSVMAPMVAEVERRGDVR